MKEILIDLFLLLVILPMVNVLLTWMTSGIATTLGEFRFFRWFVINKPPEDPFKILISFPNNYIDCDENKCRYYFEYIVHTIERRSIYPYTWSRMFIPFFVQFFVHEWVYTLECWYNTEKEHYVYNKEELEKLSPEEVYNICRADYDKVLLKRNAQNVANGLRKARVNELNGTYRTLTKSYHVENH